MSGAGNIAPADTGTLTLAALPAGLPLRFLERNGTQISVGDPDDSTVTIYRPHGEPSWAGLWYVDECRRDNRGRRWYCVYSAVIDDFGTLVEVAS